MYSLGGEENAPAEFREVVSRNAGRGKHCTSAGIAQSGSSFLSDCWWEGLFSPRVVPGPAGEIFVFVPWIANHKGVYRE
jgi:hypothetical protein